MAHDQPEYPSIWSEVRTSVRKFQFQTCRKKTYRPEAATVVSMLVFFGLSAAIAISRVVFPVFMCLLWLVPFLFPSLERSSAGLLLLPGISFENRESPGLVQF